VIASLLYEVTPTDPVTFAIVTGLLAAVALTAGGGPAVKDHGPAEAGHYRHLLNLHLSQLRLSVER